MGYDAPKPVRARHAIGYFDQVIGICDWLVETTEERIITGAKELEVIHAFAQCYAIGPTDTINCKRQKEMVGKVLDARDRQGTSDVRPAGHNVSQRRIVRG